MPAIKGIKNGQKGSHDTGSEGEACRGFGLLIKNATTSIKETDADENQQGNGLNAAEPFLGFACHHHA